MDDQEVLITTADQGERDKPSFTTQVLTPNEEGVFDFGSYRQQVIELRLALMPNIFGGDSTRVTDEILATGTEAYVLALEKNEVIGFGTITASDSNKQRGWRCMDSAYVREEKRQGGVYTKLVDERIKLALDSGAHVLYTSLLDEDQVFQLDLLKKKGFVKTKVKLRPTDTFEDEMLVLDLDMLRAQQK